MDLRLHPHSRGALKLVERNVKDRTTVFFDVSELDAVVEESQQSTPILRQGGSPGQTLLDQDQGLRRDRAPPLVPGVTATTQTGNQASNAVVVQVHRGDESPLGPY